MKTTTTLSLERRSPIRREGNDNAKPTGSETGAPSPRSGARTAESASSGAAAQVLADKAVHAPLLASLLLCVFALLPLGLRAATNELSSALQTGLFEEEANRNLPAAMEAYEKVAKQFDQNRALAATAIFRLGEVNRKLGKTNEAVAFYQRILREFSDQETLTKLSQQNLAGMGNGVETGTTSALSPAARSEQRRLLAEEIKLVEADLADIQARMRHGESPYQEKRDKERLLLQLRRQLVGLDVETDRSKPDSVSAPITAVLDEEETEIRRIQAMIQNSPDLIDAAAQDGLTPLYRAATAGQLRVARFLLDNGADINARLVLHGAAERGHKAMVELLLGRGAEVQRQNGEGQTALHLAARKGFPTVVLTLLTNGAEVNAKDKTGTTPLHLAAVAAHGATVAQLLSKGADVNAAANDGETALIRAARAGHSVMVEQLLSAKADVNHQDEAGRTALSYAAEKGHTLVIKALLAAKADPNAGKANLPLHCAIKNESAGDVEALLKAGADANRTSTLSWRNALGSSTQTYGLAVTPLAVATDKPQFQIIKLLLVHKADANGKAVSGVPLIFSAVNSAELTKAFLDAGANPNVDDGTTDQRRSPLLATGNPQVVALLLAAKANPESRHRNICDQSELGMTPLLIWTSCWNLPDLTGMVEALLKGGAEVNARTATGATALHQAAANKNKELMALLIAHKADVNARDNQGLTPLDHAEGKHLPRNPSLALPAAGIPAARLRPPDQPKVQTSDVTDLLRQHGGLADLPKLDRIEVTRPDTGYRATAFVVGTNGWNQFTLAEVLAQQWGMLSTARSGSWRFQGFYQGNNWPSSMLRFPDLARVKIHSPARNSDRRTTVNMDLSIRDDKTGAMRDATVQAGDVVEVPEADHPVTEGWQGLSATDFRALSNSVARTVTINVGGKSTNLTLALMFKSEPGTQSILTAPSFMLRSVLDESKLIRSSSDLTRVKVTRRESEKSKPRVWIVDCSVPDKAPDLWLRDGDVIEVPEK